LAITGGVEVVWPVPFWHVDAGAALMLLWLAALEEGLGAAVYGVPVEEDARWRELLAIPDDLTIVTGVTVGHPAEDPDWDRATSAHRVLAKIGVEDDVLLWNVVPTHPGSETSNRRPTRDEIEAASPFLYELTLDRVTIAVGRLAATVLDAPYVRHPSHGGAAAFEAGLRRAFATIGRRRAAVRLFL